MGKMRNGLHRYARSGCQSIFSKERGNKKKKKKKSCMVAFWLLWWKGDKEGLEFLSISLSFLIRSEHRLAITLQTHTSAYATRGVLPHATCFTVTT